MVTAASAEDVRDLQARAKRLCEDFEYYAENCLRIRPKAGGLVPFVLNEVQRAVHARLEAQRENTGRVRALILKARQPGISTYVEGRYFHRVTQREGVSAFILTHSQAAVGAADDVTLDRGVGIYPARSLLKWTVA